MADVNLEQKLNYLIPSRIRIRRNETTKLRGGLPIYPFLIRLTKTLNNSNKTPRFFIETDRIDPEPASAPTLKIMISTKDDIKTREYLPIILSSPIKEQPGTVWIPQTSMTPSRTQFSVLAITDPEAFAIDWEIHFRLDTTIYPEQLDIRDIDSSNSNPRRRRWNISTGKSTLRGPITEQADLPDPPPPNESRIPLQMITIFIEDGLTGLDEIFSNPTVYRIHLRRSLGKVNFFYEQNPNPAPGGIVVYHKNNQLFFTRIYSIKNRQIYRKICKSREWINISPPSNEFHMAIHTTTSLN